MKLKVSRSKDHLLKVRASNKLKKKGTCPSASAGMLTQWFSALAAH